MDPGLQTALGVAAIVLAALLIGALLPVLFEARAALRQARQFLAQTGRQLDQALGEATGVIAKVDRVVSELEPRARAVGETLDEAQRVLKVMVAVGASVGPAVTAAVRAFQSVRQDDGDGDGPGRTQEHPGSSPGG